MPEPPTPQDATEAALFAEYGDIVLLYADLCTTGTGTAERLATEAFALGLREARAMGCAPGRTAGRRTARLPVIPLLLAAVRATAAGWEAAGRGHQLDPGLRLWLTSGQAARYTGPPPQRPVALRGLRDLQETDATLLWLAEVEALPLPVVARRLGLDPDLAARELDQARTLFRDRCHRAHLDTPMDAECRSFARLLDAVTRSPAGDTPDDLARHLAGCARCAEAAGCLRLHGGGLPAALAGGVVGWGGLAYLERRRRAAEARLGAGRPATPADRETDDPTAGAGHGRLLRNSLLATAVLLSVLALGVSMMPRGGTARTRGSDADWAARHDNRHPSAEPAEPLPSAEASRRPLPSASPSRSTPATRSATPSATRTAVGVADREPDPEPQGTTSATASAATRVPAATVSAPAACRVEYDQVDEWTGGFQATVTVTTAEALSDWRVAWSFRDGQQVSQMWNARISQQGSRVTANATDYDASVAAHGSLSFGFLGTWHGRNSAPYAFTLNGAACAAS
ncbi:cellulose binding domain-containing protein [Streptomyces sp. MMS24-I2-30]|uniref:cellulose binding domain-containing protein n=1 Tax=Streptomyces sp. MMS24-I2-30 TaxID=3351564 RepID=UPI00389696DE